MKKYFIETITSEEEFLKLREHWNKLVFKDSNSSIFQLWEWDYFVWRCYVRLLTSHLGAITWLLPRVTMAIEGWWSVPSPCVLHASRVKGTRKHSTEGSRVICYAAIKSLRPAKGRHVLQARKR